MPTTREDAVATEASTIEASTAEASIKTKALLADLWRRNLPVIEFRLATLDRAAAAADPLDPELRAEALDVAHKLSGSLGMFGFDRGTAIARELETMLEASGPDRERLGRLAAELRAMLLPSS